MNKEEKELKIMIEKCLDELSPKYKEIIILHYLEELSYKEISDILLNEYKIYSQPINYPTVPKGTERLRFTPTPLHSDYDIEFLVNSIDEIWSKLALDR